MNNNNEEKSAIQPITKTREEVLNEIKEKISNMTPAEIIKYLQSVHPSDAYMIIRDTMQYNSMKEIKADKAIYQQFQDIKMQAQRSHEHDNTGATMKDVDAALTKVYGITVRMIKTNMDNNDLKFNAILQAINRIEEQVGLTPTKWSEGDDIDATNDEQREQKDI